MTYVKFEARHLADERWIEAGAEAFALHTWALSYSDEQDGDGWISETMARRVAFPVAPDRADHAIAVLVELGFWERESTGYRITGWARHILAASEKVATREKWSADKRRRRLHDVGNHSLCTPNTKCPVARNSIPDSGGGSTGGQVDSIPNQTRPDQTPKGSGSGVGASPVDADAPPTLPDWIGINCVPVSDTHARVIAYPRGLRAAHDAFNALAPQVAERLSPAIDELAQRHGCDGACEHEAYAEGVSIVVPEAVAINWSARLADLFATVQKEQAC